ncbi:glucose 1-dehydrogenase [Chelativorans sp. Marseille-P2723]|uniref:SDR family NAD(P)-dependent oxidoreductase n=1 Tax=Chelativorans sp. Marseille-P2723 TaxID=2709133 RepID=UPI00156D5935|nr:glucose 1-dehydrogenase [Chelativorans sp. Marseille-P2723]
MFDLSGRTAMVTGASGGLGLHFAKLLARHGAAVVLAARRVEALEEARDAIRREGGTAQAVALDVSDSARIREVVTALDPKADILINNAGLSGAGAAMDLPEAEWDRALDTNLKGAFLTAQAFAGRLREASTSGSIVNIASILGHRVAGGLSAYATSKAGLVQLTKVLALEWARYDIRVNALCPGYIETDLNRGFFETDAGKALVKRIPQRRLGQAEDLDGALLLLASDAGRYITGATLAVDGGHLVSSL